VSPLRPEAPSAPRGPAGPFGPTLPFLPENKTVNNEIREKRQTKLSKEKNQQ
jgi:hypothetical protein